jgi:hypothetical protein
VSLAHNFCDDFNNCFATTGTSERQNNSFNVGAIECEMKNLTFDFVVSVIHKDKIQERKKKLTQMMSKLFSSTFWLLARAVDGKEIFGK